MESNRKRLKMGEANSSANQMESSEKPFYFVTSDFSQVVKSPVFVDKTLLLKEFLHSESVILIKAPSRFGKSTNMDMVKKFIEMEVDENGVVIGREDSPNRKIFEVNNLLIFQDREFFDEHFATHPVIEVTLKPVFGSSFEEVLDSFKLVLSRTFQHHRYLLNSGKLHSSEKEILKKYSHGELCHSLTESEVKNGLKFLSECLYRHFGKKKVFVLIDESDAPFNNIMFEENNDLNQVNDLVCTIFSNILKGNEYIERALLTAISYYAITVFPGANNIIQCDFLGNHPFVKYYGLIEQEVDALLSKFQVNNEERSKIKRFYNGYYSEENVKLFSPSLPHYLQTKQLKSYWEQSEIARALISEALRSPLIQFAIEKLLQNDYKMDVKVFRWIKLHHIIELRYIVLGRTKDISDPDLFLNFLLKQGYLTYSHTENCVRIPNEEIRDEFKQNLRNLYGGCKDGVLEECTAAFDRISISLTQSFQEFVEKFQAVVDNTAVDAIKHNEGIFHSLLFCVICRSEFQICDGFRFFGIRRRPDLIVVKDKSGFMIEIKFRHDSKTALEQMIGNKDNTAFYSQEYKDLEDKVYLAVNVSENLKVSLAILVNTLDINEAEYFSI